MMNSILTNRNYEYKEPQSDASPTKHRRTGSSSRHTYEVSLPDEPSPLESLPDVPIDLILSKLDLPDLASLGVSSKFWQQKVTADHVYRPIAVRLNCPLKEISPIIEQLRFFIIQLQVKVKAISDRPSDISLLLGELKPEWGAKIAQIEHLQNWLVARDTLVFWEKLVEELKRQIPGLHLEGPRMKQLKNSQDAIHKAKEFSGWCTANRAVLAQLKKLDLRNMQLTWLPTEIDKLAQLERLYLGNNQFTKLPNEICTLSRLKILDLRSNQLTTFPKNFGKLTKLQELDIRDNPLPRIITKPAKLKVYQFLN